MNTDEFRFLDKRQRRTVGQFQRNCITEPGVGATPERLRRVCVRKYGPTLKVLDRRIDRISVWGHPSSPRLSIAALRLTWVPTEPNGISLGAKALDRGLSQTAAQVLARTPNVPTATSVSTLALNLRACEVWRGATRMAPGHHRFRIIPSSPVGKTGLVPSGGGPPQSRTLARSPQPSQSRSVVECASPLALWPDMCLVNKRGRSQWHKRIAASGTRVHNR
jgi:hypothetical protein